ncbi:MAG: carboxypeptidase regulatory-like domain-containing protein, partial [Armatimonadetes bacterium]|nr:carboxypeptidase regulatory-like domain-containing protein [Anaerolineae bacterium]
MGRNSRKHQRRKHLTPVKQPLDSLDWQRGRRRAREKRFSVMYALRKAGGRRGSRVLSLVLLALLLTLLRTPTYAQAVGGVARVSGSVYDAGTRSPLVGVTVALDGVALGISDSAGSFSAALDLSAAYQMTEIRLSAPGYGDWTMTPTALEPNVTRLLDAVYLGADAVTVYGGIVPGSIQRTAADWAAIAQLNTNAVRQPDYLPRGMRTDVSEFDIPMTITVGISPYLHCSDWLNAGQPIDEIITIDFKDYVRQVLPNEWISAWLPQSLQ